MSFEYISYGNSGGVAAYATFSDFPLNAADGTLAVAKDTYSLYVYSTTTSTWILISSPSSGSGVMDGDVTGTITENTVAYVGTSSAANIHSAELLANAATDADSDSTIVKRDASGNFSAATITASLTGNVSGSSASFTRNLSGDVTGGMTSTSVASVGGATAASIAATVTTVAAATSEATASTLIERDSLGGFSASAITVGTLSDSIALNIEAPYVSRSVDGVHFITETYADSITLTDNSGPTPVVAFQYSIASIAGEKIEYVIEGADVRIGTLYVATNSLGITTVVDTCGESGDCGVDWDYSYDSGTGIVSISYTTESLGSDRLMRADIKQFRR